MTGSMGDAIAVEFGIIQRRTVNNQDARHAPEDAKCSLCRYERSLWRNGDLQRLAAAAFYDSMFDLQIRCAS